MGRPVRCPRSRRRGAALLRRAHGAAAHLLQGRIAEALCERDPRRRGGRARRRGGPRRTCPRPGRDARGRPFQRPGHGHRRPLGTRRDGLSSPVRRPPRRRRPRRPRTRRAPRGRDSCLVDGQAVGRGSRRKKSSAWRRSVVRRIGGSAGEQDAAVAGGGEPGVEDGDDPAVLAVRMSRPGALGQQGGRPREVHRAEGVARPARRRASSSGSWGGRRAAGRS